MSSCCGIKIFIYCELFFSIFSIIASDDNIYRTFTIEEDLYDSFESEYDSDISSRIHEFMTPEEISDTFGVIDGSVPEYRVFSGKFPSSRRKRQISGEINLSIEINGTEINLNLIKTDGTLVTKNTPVWSAVTDYNAYNNIRYDPLPSAMTKDIGPFEMYQDRKNEAAIVIYRDDFDYSYKHSHFVMEGIVTSKYALKSLPKRLSHALHNRIYKYKVVKTPIFHNKRSIEMDVDNDELTDSYYVLFKTQRLFGDDNLPIINVPFKMRKKRRSSISETVDYSPDIDPEVVYPEILLILDHNIIRKQSMEEALRFTVAFWNGVDMIYSSLEKPKVRLNIAGIIISADDTATPYIANDTSIVVKKKSGYTCSKIGKYFYNEQQRFPWNNYDVIIAMTTIRLCVNKINPCDDALGFAFIDGACSFTHEPESNRKIDGVGFLYYNMMFGGVYTAAHETAHLFGVKHDEEQCQGFMMGESLDSNETSFQWSSCSQAAFRSFFSSKKSLCLKNKPDAEERSSMDTVLPGKWLSMDGQCQNYGYEKSCNVANFSACEVLGCIAIGSDKCTGMNLRIIPGSKCDEGKHCDSIGYKCVSD